MGMEIIMGIAREWSSLPHNQWKPKKMNNQCNTTRQGCDCCRRDILGSDWQRRSKRPKNRVYFFLMHPRSTVKGPKTNRHLPSRIWHFPCSETWCCSLLIEERIRYSSSTLSTHYSLHWMRISHCFSNGDPLRHSILFQGCSHEGCGGESSLSSMRLRAHQQSS